MRVLLIEDDLTLSAALGDVLTRRGYRTDAVARGDDALLAHRHADLVVLDLGLPDMDGFDLLRRLRRIASTPVVVMTARHDERSVVRGLRNGADDYLVKPVRLAELLARIEAVARRTTTVPDRRGRVVIDDRGVAVLVDLDARVVTVADEPVELTPKEFDVLAVLAGRVGQAVAREVVMDEVWGDAYAAVSRSLDVHVAALRAKLDRPGLIVTIRGYGYRLGE